MNRLLFVGLSMMLLTSMYHFDGVNAVDEYQNDTYLMEISFSGGDGSASNPFQISNVTQLQNVSNNLNAHYVLTNDIDASSTKKWNNGSGFDPIASEGTPSSNSWNGPKFNGSFDGNGYEVKNLWINRSDDDYIGLFGMIGTKALISNLKLSDANIVGGNYTGGLVGNSWGIVEKCEVNGSITGSHTIGGIVAYLTYKPYTFGDRGYLTRSESDCYVKGTYSVGGLVGFGDVVISLSNSTGKVCGESNVGGLAGTYSLGTLRNCTSYCDVYGKGSIGGLIGHSSGEVIDCHSKGDIIGDEDTIGIGGAVGFSYSRGIRYCSSTGDVYGGIGDIGGFSGTNRCYIIGCFSSGDVYSLGRPRAYPYYTGGFVGRTTGGLINDCFSSGDIFGFDHLGGFVGQNGYTYSSGSIKNSYCLGKVHPTQNTDSGAFVGYNHSGKIERCFFLNESNEIEIPVGRGSFNQISPLSLVEMVNMSSYEDMNWDMTTVWNISNGYTSPFLRWQENSPPRIITIDQTIATTNATYYFDYHSEDPDPTDICPEWTLKTNADWLTLDDNRTLYGIPGATDIGPYYVNITINDGRSGIDWNNFTLKVNTSNNAPNILTENDIYSDEDFIYSNHYRCDIDDGDILEWTLNTNASFLKISGNDGYISGMPMMKDIGQYSVNISVHDGQGAVEWTEFNLTVNETNDDPMILTKNLEFSWETFWYGNLYEAYDEEDDELNWILETNTSWLQINQTSGFLKGYPDQGDNGSFFVNVTLKDIRGGETWTNFTLRIYPTIGSGNVTNPIRIWNSTHFRMIELDLDRNYQMINDINASMTRNLNGGKGIIPIGGRYNPFTDSKGNRFTGTFDGNGFNITDLWINRTNEANIGLFHFLYYRAVVKDLSILNATIKGGERTGAISGSFWGDPVSDVHVTGSISGSIYVGGLFGYAIKDIIKCSFNGKVTGWSDVGGITGHCTGEIKHTTFHAEITGGNKLGGLTGSQSGNAIRNCSGYASINGNDELGGLIGCNQECNVDKCSANGMITGSNKIGGLVGILSGFYHQNYPIGHIFDSWSNVSVMGLNYVGGLSGKCTSKVMNSYSLGNVNGNEYCGGLIGYTDDRIETSYSTGDVTGSSDNVGGLIGRTTGQIYKCYARGNVIGLDYVGGLCGRSGDKVEQSFSYGDVSGDWYVGGLIGYVVGEVSNCFSTSKINGTSRVAGLIGMAYKSTVTKCYSMGEVSFSLWGGGLVGHSNTLTCTNSFWDMESSGQKWSDKGTGLKTSEMIDSGTYLSNGWDLTYVWNIAHNMTYPFLRWKSFNSPPKLSLNGSFNATEDIPYTLQFNRSDPDIIDVKGRWIIDTNATWLNIDIPNCKVEGTPGNEDVGTYWINLTLKDGRGGSDVINITITVSNVNDNPTLNGNHIHFASEDQLYESFYTTSDIDPTNDDILFDMKTNATWLDFDSKEGRVFGTPEQDDIGVYWVNLSLDDGNGGTYWDRFEIEVLNTNDNPYFVTQQFPDAIEDEVYELLVEVDDIDPTDDRIRWKINGTNLDILKINKYTGLITFQPENNDVGQYWALITISDGQGGYATKNFTINITNVNDDPVLSVVDDRFVTEDEEFFIQMEGFDIDSDPDGFTWEIDFIPSFTKFDERTGNLTGLPLNDDDGIWEFEVTLHDGDGGKDVTSFKIVVAGVNDPPVTTQSVIEVSLEEDANREIINLNEYVSDEEGDELFFFPGNSHNLTISNDRGAISIIPKQNYHGIEEINVDVTDGSSMIYITLKIEVTSRNDPPVIVDIFKPESAKNNEMINISCMVEDIDGDKLSFKWTSNISGELGSLPKISKIMVAGLHNITLRIDDEHGGFAERSFEIPVENSSPAEEPEDQTEPEEEKKDNSIIWIIGMVLLIILLVILGAVFYLKKSNDEENSEHVVGGNTDQPPSSTTTSPPKEAQHDQVENDDHSLEK